MKSDGLRVALVGAGRISERHVSAIRAPGFRGDLVAVCDVNLERAQKVAIETGIPAYSSLADLLKEQRDLDLISICTPSGTHYGLALEVLETGTPMLIEKPLVLSTEQAQSLVKLSKERGVSVFVVKQNRLNPPILKTRERLESGSLGRLLSASANVIWCRPSGYYLQDPWRLTREMDGGVVWNQASHYVDLLVHLLDPIVSVSALGANYLSPSEAEDTVHAIFETESGQIASLFATTAARPKNFEGSLTLVTEGGVLRVGGHALNELVADSTIETSNREMDIPKWDVDSVYGEGHRGVYAQVAEDLLGGKDSEFRIENGVATVALIQAIHFSISEKRRVYLDEFFVQQSEG